MIFCFFVLLAIVETRNVVYTLNNGRKGNKKK